MLTSLDALRLVGEPIFDAYQTDTSRSIHKTFPLCLEEPAFMFALTYSLLQISDVNTGNLDALSIQGRAFAEIQKAIDACVNLPPTPGLIGAIMVLRAVAYRTDDTLANKTHRDGLRRLLFLCQEYQEVRRHQQAGLTSDYKDEELSV
jgi:hypothetical protein